MTQTECQNNKIVYMKLINRVTGQKTTLEYAEKTNLKLCYRPERLCIMLIIETKIMWSCPTKTVMHQSFWLTHVCRFLCTLQEIKKVKTM